VKTTIETYPRRERQTIFSTCRQYRYTLWREWDMINPSFAMIVGLNPSTADETKDDPTVRRCIEYAKSWGYGALCMTNIFAFRATDPKDMKSAGDPVGPDNNLWLRRIADYADIVIAAWGTHGNYCGRDNAVLAILDSVSCLGVTKAGHPKHPLYLPKGLQPIPFQEVHR